MDRFELSFDLGNEAFDASGKRKVAIVSLLRETAGFIDRGNTEGFVYDTNGNRVGQWSFPDVEVDEEIECDDCGALYAEGGECWQCAENEGSEANVPL